MKIGQLAKAIAHKKPIIIAFAKWSLWAELVVTNSALGQKLKMPKTCEKPFYKKIRIK